ncbi:MAG TPA: radical SAM family heme chaperone HemW [Baekduia sp.]|uniref:radical SAM family heme chaperone HemW n=1 Tax=Baekduia sp. TaxID=2600305 RepID=UPI002D77648F|nr:radical SAM family heme chaperone HemW [Baekduia sp.]HET6507261.1 radical SAM family heme chaperone HemW [Baekduia sp.]
MARLPDGDRPPHDGTLPAAALRGLGAPGRPFGVYVHVPYCTTRCGYCDFNTYIPSEAGPEGYVGAVAAELALARRVLGDAAPPVATVFVGGGTPTLLPAADLAAVVALIDEHLGLAPGAEVTTEANPESVDPAKLAALRAAGFTRISLGMQSAAPHVLATLDRHHTPGRAVAAAREARAAGFEHVSLDLIYGTPGETAADWQMSVETALDADPDHVSAYSLIVEPGTRLAARVRRGELPTPDDDVLAERYETTEALMAQAGLGWYEVSNWARTAADRCRHNMGYWAGGDWWGVGPGAHSHVGGVRWWNALHPARWMAALADGASPAAGRETPDDDAARLERVMLEVRLRDGLALDATQRDAAARLADDGLLELDGDRAVLTLRGRLLADRVTLALAG